MNLSVPENFEAIAGRGIQAVLGGKTVLAGNRKMMQENGVDASIGGVWQASTENLENLLRRADENMYREKKRYYSQADAARKPES